MLYTLYRLNELYLHCESHQLLGQVQITHDKRAVAICVFRA